MALKHRVECMVISLPESPRRRAIDQNLCNLKFPWSYMDACAGSYPDGPISNPASQIDRYGRVLTAGEIGCFKSHMKAISTFDEREDLEWLLIIEDDVWLDTGFDFCALIDYLNAKNIDYLRLFCRQIKPSSQIGSFRGRQILRFSTDPYGTQAYLINRVASAAFRSGSQSIDMPIDDYYGRFWEHGVRILTIFPFPAVERETESTIDEQRSENPIAVHNFTIKRRLNRGRDWLAKKVRHIVLKAGESFS